MLHGVQGELVVTCQLSRFRPAGHSSPSMFDVVAIGTGLDGCVGSCEKLKTAAKLEFCVKSDKTYCRTVEVTVVYSVVTNS